MKLSIRQAHQHIFTVTTEKGYSHILRGKFGNYLLGQLDASSEGSQDTLKSVGGIKYQIPLSAKVEHQSYSVSLFKKFGAAVIAIDDILYSHFTSIVPCFNLRDRVFCDLKIKIINTAERKLKISFRNKPYRLSTLDNIESFEFLEQIIAYFKTNRFVCHYDENINAIAFFDDIEFERNDYEIVQPGLRKHICHALSKHSFEKQEKNLYSKSVSKIVIAPPPRVLMSDPTEEIADLPDEVCKIITPTQMAILILQSNNEDWSQDLESLAAKLPFNIKKFTNYVRKGDKQVSEDLLEKIKYLQNKCLDFYRKNRCKDGIGRSISTLNH